MRKACITLAIGLTAMLAVAKQPNETGLFETSPGVDGDIKRLCVKQLASTNVRVSIFAGYCPSIECLNYRPDSITFESKIRNGIIEYRGASLCKIKVRFSRGIAEVTQTDYCRNDQHPNLYANGTYLLTNATPTDDECSK